MKVMILAAGLGSRMRPLTLHTPKPLLEVGGKPLIVWHIERLAKLGFKEIVINIAYLGYQIPQKLGDGSLWGVNIVYSDEQEEGALESAGGIVKALPLLGDNPFLVVNADIWCDYPFAPEYRFKLDTLAHLVLVPNPEHNPLGDFTLEEQRLEPNTSHSKKYTFSGIGYYTPAFFKEVAYGKSALAPLLKEAIVQGHVSGELYHGAWFDIGTPERLEALNRVLNI